MKCTVCDTYGIETLATCTTRLELNEGLELVYGKESAQCDECYSRLLHFPMAGEDEDAIDQSWQEIEDCRREVC